MFLCLSEACSRENGNLKYPKKLLVIHRKTLHGVYPDERRVQGVILKLTIVIPYA
jgi:hypothetical protein